MNLLIIFEIIFFIATISLLYIHQVFHKKYRKKCNMEGKTIVMTGGSTGLGAAGAIEFVKKGAKVIITGRNIENVKKTIKSLTDSLRFYNYIQGELDRPKVEIRLNSLLKGKWTDNEKNFQSEFFIFRSLDQLDLTSCRNLCEWIKKKFEKIDILINNAGAAMDKKKLSKQDLEATLAINHFSHVLITHDLLPLLKKSEKARIIITSSEAHRIKFVSNLKISINDMLGEKEVYSGFGFYCRSKLANVLFTNSLKTFLEKNKVEIGVYSFHPGTVYTELAREGNLLIKTFVKAMKFISRSPYGGCQTAIYLACENMENLISGEYYDNNAIGKMVDFAKDKVYCDQFWNKTLEIIESKIEAKLENFEKLEIK